MAFSFYTNLQISGNEVLLLYIHSPTRQETPRCNFPSF